VRFLCEAEQRGIHTVVLYADAAEKQSRRFTEFSSYLGYNFGERNVIGCRHAENLREIADEFVARVAAKVAARKKAGWGRLLTTSSSFYLDYEVAAGVEIPVVEDFAFRNFGISSALCRGLERQYKLEFWGAHIAHEHYSWIRFDNPRKFPLLLSAFFLKYLHGAKMIVNESGHWCLESQKAPDAPMLLTTRIEADGLIPPPPEEYATLIPESEKTYHLINYNSKYAGKYRKTISEFYDFIKANGTPEGRPEACFAIAKGCYDLVSTPQCALNMQIGNASHLADKNRDYFSGDSERGWEIVQKLFAPCPSVLGGELNQYLAVNPRGLFDIVSFAGMGPGVEALGKYKLLLFAGWNTSSEEQYRLLLDYVRNGGMLAIGIAHLSTNFMRNHTSYGIDELVRGGDFSELCGVRVLNRGRRVYWAENANDSMNGFSLPHRTGILYAHIGDIEITDPSVKKLVVEDERLDPLILERKCGKGKVFFLNFWNDIGALDIDEGPGACDEPRGMISALYDYLASLVPGTVQLREEGALSKYVAWSYFPDAEKLCLLNIDFDREHAIEASSTWRSEVILLAPGEFRMLDWPNNTQ
jgi:hypothetical protein